MITIAVKLIRLPFTAAIIFVLLYVTLPASGKASGDHDALTDIKVSFKLDPQLTKAVYMGDRWVSPQTFTGVREGKEFTVEVRAHGLDAKGKSVMINPTWVTENAGMVSVAPGQGNEVRVTIKKAGKSSIKVLNEDVSKTLFIKATQQNNILNIEISQ